MESSGHAAARCVVLGEHDAPGYAAIERAVEDGGFEVTAVTGRWAELLVAVVEGDPEAVVLDLAMAGRSGVRLVAALRALAPRCRIVVLSELRAIDLSAVEAGAWQVVDPADLRPLVAALRRPATSPAQA